DGAYRAQLVVADAAGNRATRTWTVRLDRTPPTVAITAPARFSPNRDGVADTARLAWTMTEPAAGAAALYHGSTLVRSWPVSASTAGAVAWHGRGRTGAPGPAGTSTLRVGVRDAAGNRTTKSATVIVDRTLSGLHWSTAAFFPQDGDRLAATAAVGFGLARTAKVSLVILAGTN